MKKKNRSVYIVLIIVLLIGVTIGYAALNATLNINGKSNVSKNTWDLHFDNVQIRDGSVSSVKEPTITNPTEVDFEVNLNLPGDYYEFCVDVVNSGTIDAMIESIEKLPELTPEQQKYFNYVIEYQSEKQIQNNQLVKAGEFVRFKVRIEYRTDIEVSDLPSNIDNLDLGFTLNYVQSNELAVPVKDNGVFKVKANGSLDEVGTVVTIGTEQFYVIGSDSENVKLFAKHNLYVGNNCTWNPITCIPYGDEATGIQNEEMMGMYSSGSSSKIKGTTEFSSDQHTGSNYSSYNGSIVESYVNNYKNILENKYGVDIKEARLISKNELTNSEIGCDNSSCSNALYWVKNSVYWIGDVYNNSMIYFVHNSSNGYRLDFSNYYNKHVAGVRPVLVLAKSDIVVDNTPFAAGDINEIGTVVTIGSEQFYTIGIDENNVKLLSMMNISLGDNRRQNSVAGSTAFSNEEQHGISYVDYSGSLVEKYVNEYKSFLEQDLNIEVKEARVISYDELLSLGCANNGCKDAPSFIYSAHSASSYWTSTKYLGTDIWVVSYDGSIGSSSYDNSSSKGVRPIIIISKNYF